MLRQQLHFRQQHRILEYLGKELFLGHGRSEIIIVNALFLGLLLRCQQEGRPVSLASLEGDFTPEEMNHLSSVARRRDALISEQAISDCCNVIREAYGRSVRTGEDALRAMQQQFQHKKGYGG